MASISIDHDDPAINKKIQENKRIIGLIKAKLEPLNKARKGKKIPVFPSVKSKEIHPSNKSSDISNLQ